MSKLTLTKTRLLEGVWQGRSDLRGRGQLPARYSGDPPARGYPRRRDRGKPRAEALDPPHPDPPEKIADGVQTFLILDRKTGETLDSFTLIAGDALSDDIRAEVTLLREELDMLKRAFRRHCLETM